MTDPAKLYARRFAKRQERCKRLKRRQRWLGNIRLVAAGLALLVLWWIETSAPALRWYAVATLLAMFLASSRLFRRLDRQVIRATVAQILYLRATPGHGRSKAAGLDTEGIVAKNKLHPYASDADITGPGGLVDYLSIAATMYGARVLAARLLHPASKSVILARQAAVAELRPRVGLRERFFVEGLLRGAGIRTDQLRECATEEVPKIPRWFPWACRTASVLTLLAGVALLFETTTAGWAALGTLLASEAGLWRFGKRFLKPGFARMENATGHFERLRALVRMLETLAFESPELRRIRDDVLGEGEPASAALRSVGRRIALYEARRNQVVALAGPLLLYETQAAIALQRWMSHHAKRLPQWIDAIAAFETYLSLSSFAFENPAYTFPEISDERPRFRAEGLAHPLLGPEAVENDVALDLSRPVLVVSGANMAGKSTLLRSVAVNMALTYAGAPVRAHRLKVSPMITVASIRIQDSLQEGRSRFAAELVRIGMALESIRSDAPTLVVVDELFAGTNSYDRYAGAVALSSFLAESGRALAILSTHDRNVTRWAEQRPDFVTNSHFRDVLAGTEMHFDYKLHAGPAKRGNAVELMRQAGIPMVDISRAPAG